MTLKGLFKAFDDIFCKEFKFVLTVEFEQGFKIRANRIRETRSGKIQFWINNEVSGLIASDLVNSITRIHA